MDVGKLEKQKAGSLLSCLCHASEDVQIKALLALERVGDKRAVPFLLIYADYEDVFESGSRNATLHSIIHESIAKTMSIQVVLHGQDPEGLRMATKAWRKWQVENEVSDDWLIPPHK